MRLMTYNVQSGRDAWGQLRLDGCCEMIKRLDPDILGLNELRKGCSDSGNVDQPAYIAKQTGLEHRFAKAIPMGDGGEYGIGLFSRFPITEFRVFPVPEVPLNEREPGYYEPRVIYRGVVETPEGKLAVYGTHFGLTRPERAYAVRLLGRLLETETLRHVFMGDLNMTPDDPLIGQIREKITDTHAPIPMMTCHTLKLDETIDYIFVSEGIEADEAKAYYSVASDHLPVMCNISLSRA